jgi:hypothetical protein
MNTFCQAWAGTYDAVFYCCDRYSQHQDGDPYRAKVLDLQSAADRVIRSTCASVGQRVIDIPPAMTTSERVRWIASRLAKLGITADARAARSTRPLPPCRSTPGRCDLIRQAMSASLQEKAEAKVQRTPLAGHHLARRKQRIRSVPARWHESPGGCALSAQRQP